MSSEVIFEVAGDLIFLQVTSLVLFFARFEGCCWCWNSSENFSFVAMFLFPRGSMSSIAGIRCRIFCGLNFLPDISDDVSPVD